MTDYIDREVLLKSFFPSGTHGFHDCDEYGQGWCQNPSGIDDVANTGDYCSYGAKMDLEVSE